MYRGILATVPNSACKLTRTLPSPFIRRLSTETMAKTSTTRRLSQLRALMKEHNVQIYGKGLRYI